eukprot:166463_1
MKNSAVSINMPTRIAQKRKESKAMFLLFSILIVIQFIPFASSLIQRPVLPSLFHASTKSILNRNRSRRNRSLTPIGTSTSSSSSGSCRQSSFINENSTLATEIRKRNPSTLFSLSFDTDEKTDEAENVSATEGHNAEESESSPTTASTTEMAGKSGTRTLLAGVASAYLVSATLLAKSAFLGPYTDILIARDAGVTILCTVLATAFVKTITYLASKGILESRDSRKIIHTCSAPLFMLLWPLFTDLPGGKIFAAFIPALQGCRLWLAGTNQGGENELAGAISRSGDANEALKGPLIYVIILFSAVSLFFRDSLTGVIALSTMAAGDGLADIFGRRFGKDNKWFFNQSKSIAGSTAFFAGASLCSIGLSAWLTSTGAVSVDMGFSEI